MKKRLLAMLMAVAMMLSLLPTAAFAAGETAAKQADLTPADTVVKHSNGTTLATLSKKAVDRGDGTYDVTLRVTASEQIESQPVEIVLVLDSSGSMNYCSDSEYHEHGQSCQGLICNKNHMYHGPSCYGYTCEYEHVHSYPKNSDRPICSLVEDGTASSRMEIVKNKAIGMLSDIADIGGNVKVAVVDFDSSASTACGLTAVTQANIAENSPLVNAINGMVAEGGTQPQDGLALANSILGNGDQYAKKVVILLADGEADSEKAATSAVTTATTMKSSGIEIFTIGFKTQAAMLSQIATDANHYATADSETQLEDIFDNIVNGLAAMILDPMGSFVDLQGGENGVAVSLDGSTYTNGLVVTKEEQIEWNKQGGLTKNQTVTLNYTVKLDEAAFLANHDAGTHIVDLNGAARLNYSYKNQGGRASFPLPKAEVGIGQLTTKVILDGKTENSIVRGNEIIVYPKTDEIFSWELPAANDEITVDGDTYVYVNSTYDGKATTETSAPVTAGAHTLIHNYVKVIPKGNLTITKTVSGLIDNDTLPQDFKITVTGPNGYTNELDLREAVADYTWTLNDLTPGDYTVTESNYKVAGYDVNATGNGTVPATVVDKQTATAALTNEYTPATYNVTYEYSNDAPEGAPIASENNKTAQYKSEVTVADKPSVAGYTFSGWSTTDADVSDGKFSMPAKDVKLTGSWSANTDTKYTVEHYKQGVDLKYPDTASESKTLTGTTGETATATPKDYAGFTYAPDAKGTITSGEIAGDGSLVLKLYYTRNTYNVVYQITGSHFTNANYETQSDILFESPLKLIEDNMEKGGYVWSGWTGLPTTMPDHNVIVTGSYTAANDTAYKVEHYKQNLDGTGYDLAETENLTGTTGETATAEAKTYEGFTFDANAEGTVKSGIIAADGSLVLKLFYTRNAYKVSYQYTNTPAGASELPATVSYKYGASVTVADDATAPGYTFNGWSTEDAEIGADDEFTMPAKAVKITGSFSARTDLSYTVKYLEEGTNKALATDKVVNDQTFGREVIENAINITGYTVVGDASKSLTIAVTDNVITFYYAVDIWDDPDNNTTDGDGTADKYQVLVRYESESASKGSVAPGLEVLTIYGDNQTPVASGDVTAVGSTATAGDNYVFTKWSMTAMPEEYTALSDIATNTTGWIALNGVEGKNEFTFTAYFTEKDTTVDVNKAVTKITAPDGTAYETLTSAKVGDTITWTITAENKGNVEQTLTLADELSNAANVTVKDSAGATVTTVTLSAGEKETYTATYTVAPSDAGDILINTAILKDGDTKKDEGSSDGVKVDPSLKIDKTVSKSTVTVGDKITYTIKVTNNTNTELKNIVVKDTMLGLEQTIDTLAAGASKDIIKDYTVTTQNIGTLKNTATATDEANNTYQDSVDTTVNKKPSKPSTDIPDKVPLETEDHYAYIIGYPDGNVKPAGNITRAEVATIFFRLLTDEARDLFWSTTNEYSDVAADQWFNNAISTLSNAGIINGYEDGSFRPNNPITRAEFAKIAASFFTYAEKEYQGLFSDVPAEKWYALFVEAASDLGLVTGYEDGTFRPEQFITRAESCTIVNRTIDRHPHEDQLHEDMVVWPDNPAPGEAGHMWYYEQVQEATNSHDYEMKDNYENWTEILENRDWGALEKEWSDSNSAPGGEVMQ